MIPRMTVILECLCCKLCLGVDINNGSVVLLVVIFRYKLCDLKESGE